MSKSSWKKAREEKRLEAGYLMTESQRNKCNAIIHTAAVASGAAGAIPIPVADAIPITAAQVTMALSLGKVFEQKMTEAAAKGAIGAAAATFVGRNLIKFIPIVGWGVSAAVAAGITEAIGWTIAVDLAKKYRSSELRKASQRESAEARAENENMKRNGNYNDYDDDIDDLTGGSSSKSSGKNYALGRKYYYGEGVPGNKREAYRLMKLAAEQGNTCASDFLQKHRELSMYG